MTLPSGLRHDLLNALNAVLGFATLLESDLPAGEHRRWANRLLTAAREAQALAERIPSTRSRPKGSRILLVAAGAEGDALELGLDRAGFDIVRVSDLDEADEIIATARDDIDIVLTKAGHPSPESRPGLPMTFYTHGEQVTAMIGRLQAAVGNISTR